MAPRLPLRPPRDSRAIQYFAYPDWPFDPLRDTHPDGRHEAGLDIRPETWASLQLHVTTKSVVATVDEQPALTVERPRGPPNQGGVGLFVDIAAEAFFADLPITAEASSPTS